MANDITTEPTAETDAEFAERFAELNARWKEETGHSSKIKTMREHFAFIAIVAMGPRAVPFLLANLERDDSFAFLALSQITQINQVPKESAGKIDEMAAAWLAWGHAQGYRWEHVV
jgi:hypothetical protein